MNLAAGIEIGGTKVQAGVGLIDDQLVSLARADVDVPRGGAGIREALPALVQQAAAQAGCSVADLRAVGIGFGGPVDSRRGLTLLSHQIDGWESFPLADWARRQWHVPVFIENDASIAGYAEAILGAGRGRSRVFYVTIGSGIGGGLVIDGRLDGGQGFGSAEIGHSYVPHPATGRRAKLELVCSGWSIGQRAREAIAAGERSSMVALAGGRLEAVNARTVHAAAEAGDALALRLLEETTDTLATALCNVIALLDPERIILGGGVSLMGPLLWEPLRRKVADLQFAPYAGTCEIVPAALGEEVVVKGACLLALRESGEVL